MRERASRASASPGRISHSCSQFWRARGDVAQRLLVETGERAHVVGLGRGVGHDALDLQVEDARELGGLAERRVESLEGPERSGVVGVEADDILPARGRALGS